MRKIKSMRRRPNRDYETIPKCSVPRRSMRWLKRRQASSKLKSKLLRINQTTLFYKDFSDKDNKLIRLAT
jgi:hypothetical protein